MAIQVTAYNYLWTCSCIF